MWVSEDSFRLERKFLSTAEAFGSLENLSLGSILSNMYSFCLMDVPAPVALDLEGINDEVAGDGLDNVDISGDFP